MFGKFRFRGEGGGSGKNDHEFSFFGNIERPLREGGVAKVEFAQRFEGNNPLRTQAFS